MKLNQIETPASPIVVGTKARALPSQANPISRFSASVSSGSVTIAAATGLAIKAPTIQLVRSYTQDKNKATLLQSWSGPFHAQQTFNYTDSAATATAYYWLVIVYDATLGTTQYVGPQIAYLSGTATGAVQVSAFSASITPGSGGTVTVGVTFAAPNSAGFAFVQIIATNYNGIAGQQVVAQGNASGFSFPLNATGETVTLQCDAVALTGRATPGGPTQTVVLTETQTVPCVVYGGSAVQTANGYQISWPQNPESGTTYKVYRDGATLIATVPHTLETTVSYVDVVSGAHTYTIVATNSIGSAAASPTITPGAASGVQGTGATASALTVANGTNKSVAVASITAAGSGYYQAPLVTFSGSTLGQDATGTATLNKAGGVGSIALTSAGLYASGDTVAVSIHY